jgi:C4-dicarboxylate-specific signal transduction histidine kinase
MTRVLLAEDDAVTRALLARLAGQWGYDVVAVPDGDRALALLEDPSGPRLAVLDWHMPGCDGVEICRRLSRRGPGAPYVHVILITSTLASEGLSEALDHGAHDFMTKPLVPHEFKSRLGVGQRVLTYNEELAAKNAELRRYTTQLEELAATRAKQLLHADRMATIGMLTSGVAHEVNNPTTFISGNAQTIRQFWQDVEPVVRRALPSSSGDELRKLEFVLEELPRALDGIQGGVKRIASIVRGLKTYSRQAKVEKQPCYLDQVIQSAMNLCTFDLNKRQVQVRFDIAASLPPVHGDSQQLEQVLINLAMNAAQAMEDRPERRLEIHAVQLGKSVRVSIDDTGPGVPANLRERIWQPFFTTKAAGEGTGLGLSICRDIVKEHDGELSLEPAPAGGARFVISLPALERRDAA